MDIRTMSAQMLWTVNGIAAKYNMRALVDITAHELKYRTAGI